MSFKKVKRLAEKVSHGNRNYKVEKKFFRKVKITEATKVEGLPHLGLPVLPFEMTAKRIFTVSNKEARLVFEKLLLNKQSQ
jgi:hypothetical protein